MAAPIPSATVNGAQPPTLGGAPRPSADLPFWVRLLDGATLFLVVLLLSALFTGGFRLRVGSMKVTAESPVRVAAFLVALVTLRHGLVRREPLPRRVLAWGRALAVSPASRSALAVTLTTRVAVVLTGYLAVAIIGFPPQQPPPFRVSFNEFVNLPARWDAGWYLGIATDGYSYNRRSRGQQNIAFFPAYPILMRTAGMLLGGSRSDATMAPNTVEETFRSVQTRALTAGVAISFAAFFWALVYLHRLSRELGADATTAGTSLALLSAYPFALFFGAAYTESLFLLGLAGAFLHVHRREYVAAGAWGLLVGLTRPNGCLLSVPLALIVWRDWWRARRTQPPTAVPWGRLRDGTIAAAMPGVGMLAFSAWMWDYTGHPFAWLEAHAAWGRTYRGLDTLFGDRVKAISDVGLYAYTQGLPIEFANALATVFVLVLVLPVMYEIGAAYGVFLLINVVPPLARGGFLSMGRVTSVMFPVFLYLALRLPPAMRAPTIAAFAALQGLFAALFYTWRPLY